MEKFNYGIEKINAPRLWSKGYTGKGVVVAVIDSGCQKDHPDLINSIIGGYNFSDDSLDPFDYSDQLSHGTHVSGIIAGTNTNKMIGVAPGASLLILKIINRKRRGSLKELIKAINFAIEWVGDGGIKVKIISISLSTITQDPDLYSVISKAIKNNIVVVSSPANHGFPGFPALYQQVISVGSYSYKTQGKQLVDFLAPGEKIYSAVPMNLYYHLTGNSMAAPHISGAIALLLNRFEFEVGRAPSFYETFSLLQENTKISTQQYKELFLK
ncbi:S8 family serine peptidase [Paenibacillus sp. HW567]|uniref:S8 family serine peptidase n=1 Tax=Paenibacillus sp. HW567 TaxID=1034769 RepID=UPI0003680CE8|nr:S8 family serine peptidase [Paenibacillus sp. HW567]